ncbi:MAG TPA: hypothetical protein VN257_00160, partial [Actinotalea sp.]|nr:hypothetical protein [Actinotalea sp.]
THPAVAGQWYNAIAGRWTDEANDALKALLVPLESQQQVADVASAILRGDADTIVFVEPARLGPTRALVPTELADRILSW